jgi:hypothetical protein
MQTWSLRLSTTSQSPNDKGAVVEDLRFFFEDYGARFSELASGQSSRHAVLLDYYAVPSSLVSASGDRVMLSAEAVTGYGGVGEHVERLRSDGFVSTSLTGIAITLANPRSAVVEASWLRRYSSGEALDFNAIYILTHGVKGWRIITVIEKAA